MKEKPHRVSIIGAGQVGSTLAMRVVESGLADVILLDVLNDVARGKAFDILDAAPIIKHERNIIGTSDYEDIKGSEIVVITAGFPRKPGITREELISKNASIVKEVSANIKNYAPTSIIIVVTNPLDVMAYLAFKTANFKKEKVFGMAGVLDASRFIELVASELKIPRSSIETYVLGSHGDTMIPILSHTRISGKPILEVLRKDKIESIIKRTQDRGIEIVTLLGAGSAYYSPSAAVFKMINAVLSDAKETLVVSCYLNGEYGLKDIFIGVPCKIGRGGIEEIIELDLSEKEKTAFVKSAQTIKKAIELL